MTTANPVVDRSVFNYGAALGRPKHAPVNLLNPWNDASPAAQYDAITAFAARLAKAQLQLSRHAWALEMALKHVRDACTPEEQAAKLAEALEVWHVADRGTAELDGGGAKWFRYGRIGDVLRRFTPRFPR